MKSYLMKSFSLALVFCVIIGAFSGCQQAPEQTAPVTTEPTTAPTVPDSRTWAEHMLDAYCDYSGLHESVYPQSLLELLEKNSETLQFVLEYPIAHNKTYRIDMAEYANSDTVPLFLQWDQRWGYIQYGNDVAGITACGPLCLSMVAYYLTGDPNMSPDKMIEFSIEEGHCVPGNGSAWTLISQGAKDLGFQVKELPLVEALVRRELESGKPVICVMGPGIFTTTGHFIVLTGYENGMYRVNDPNSIERSNQLWRFDQFQDQIRNMWAISK